MYLISSVIKEECLYHSQSSGTTSNFILEVSNLKEGGNKNAGFTEFVIGYAVQSRFTS